MATFYHKQLSCPIRNFSKYFVAKFVLGKVIFDGKYWMYRAKKLQSITQILQKRCRKISYWATQSKWRT